MKYLILSLIFFANQSLAWETDSCIGSKESRIKALQQLGSFAEKYIQIHGKLPDLLNESNPEFNKGIPEALSTYLLQTNAHASSNEKPESIEYSCKIPSKRKNNINDSEMCSYFFGSKRIECGKFTTQFTVEHS